MIITCLFHHSFQHVSRLDWNVYDLIQVDYVWIVWSDTHTLSLNEPETMLIALHWIRWLAHGKQSPAIFIDIKVDGAGLAERNSPMGSHRECKRCKWAAVRLNRVEIQAAACTFRLCKWGVVRKWEKNLAEELSQRKRWGRKKRREKSYWCVFQELIVFNRSGAAGNLHKSATTPSTPSTPWPGVGAQKRGKINNVAFWLGLGGNLLFCTRFDGIK